MLDRQEVDRQNALQVSEAVDRAGAIVSEQIRSIMEQAEANAEEILRNANREVEELRQQVAESAARMLERVQALEGPLSELADQLRREAEALNSAAIEPRQT